MGRRGPELVRGAGRTRLSPRRFGRGGFLRSSQPRPCGLRATGCRLLRRVMTAEGAFDGRRGCHDSVRGPEPRRPLTGLDAVDPADRDAVIRCRVVAPRVGSAGPCTSPCDGHGCSIFSSMTSSAMPLQERQRHQFLQSIIGSIAQANVDLSGISSHNDAEFPFWHKPLLGRTMAMEYTAEIVLGSNPPVRFHAARI